MASSLPAVFARRFGDGAFTVETPDSLLAVLRHDGASGAFRFRLPVSPDAQVVAELADCFGNGLCSPDAATCERAFLDSSAFPLTVSARETDLGGDLVFLAVSGAAVRPLLRSLSDTTPALGVPDACTVFLPLLPDPLS